MTPVFSLIHKEETPAERTKPRDEVVTRDEYEVRNAKGVTLCTSPDRALAVQFVKDRVQSLPGLRVERVIVTERRLLVYRPRAPKPFVVAQ